MTEKIPSSYIVAAHAERMRMLAWLPDDALISIKEYCSFTGRSRPTTYRDIRTGRIDPPLKFGNSSKYRLGYVRSVVRELKCDEAHDGAGNE